MLYQVRYFYLATGMEGRPDTYPVGDFEADSPKEACDKAALAEYPTDVMYGGGYSTRDFFRACLSAKPVILTEPHT